MLGGLFEVSTSPASRIGLFGTWVRTRSDRTPLRAGNVASDYELIERSWQVGGYGLVDLSAVWRLEGWVVREARPERRDDRGPADGDVDYEDRAWLGSVAVRGQARSG